MLPASIRVRHIAEASSRLIMGRRLRITERVSPQTLVPPHGSVKGKTWARGNDGREGDRQASVSCGAESGLAAAGGRGAKRAGDRLPRRGAFCQPAAMATQLGKRYLCDNRGTGLLCNKPGTGNRTGGGHQ